MTVILLLMALVIGFTAGFGVKSRISIDYKKRWEGALRLMDELRANGEIEKKVVIEKKIVKEIDRSSEDQKALKRLHGMSAVYRRSAEEARLRAGLPPIDDLKGISSVYTRSMLENRYRHGYDDNGRKFK